MRTHQPASVLEFKSTILSELLCPANASWGFNNLAVPRLTWTAATLASKNCDISMPSKRAPCS
eukprot:scaffold167195_cov15-Tisochrysis_lutea.AAC.1